MNNDKKVNNLLTC